MFFSRNTWIYFFNTKDEVFGHFQEFKALLEDAIGKHINVLRLENGGEYTKNNSRSYVPRKE